MRDPLMGEDGAWAALRTGDPWPLALLRACGEDLLGIDPTHIKVWLDDQEHAYDLERLRATHDVVDPVGPRRRTVEDYYELACLTPIMDPTTTRRT